MQTVTLALIWMLGVIGRSVHSNGHKRKSVAADEPKHTGRRELLFWLPTGPMQPSYWYDETNYVRVRAALRRRVSRVSRTAEAEDCRAKVAMHRQKLCSPSGEKFRELRMGKGLARGLCCCEYVCTTRSNLIIMYFERASFYTGCESMVGTAVLSVQMAATRNDRFFCITNTAQLQQMLYINVLQWCCTLATCNATKIMRLNGHLSVDDAYLLQCYYIAADMRPCVSVGRINDVMTRTGHCTDHNWEGNEYSNSERTTPYSLCTVLIG